MPGHFFFMGCCPSWRIIWLIFEGLQTTLGTGNGYARQRTCPRSPRVCQKRGGLNGKYRRNPESIITQKKRWEQWVLCRLHVDLSAKYAQWAGREYFLGKVQGGCHGPHSQASVSRLAGGVFLKIEGFIRAQDGAEASPGARPGIWQRTARWDLRPFALTPWKTSEG
jgi:hypothetical protein